MAPVIRIESSIQLLVEGNDQRNFFEAFIQHLSLANIQIQNFGGVDDLRGFLLAFRDAPGFQDKVHGIGIVRDSETSAKSAFESIRSSLRNAELPVPDRTWERTSTDPTIAVMLLPDGCNEGMLETLLCQTFAGTAIGQCIDALFECVEPLAEPPTKRPEKARAHAYLATRPDPHLSVGVAAKRGYWDLDHSAFGGVQTFLKSLVIVPPTPLRRGADAHGP